MYGSIGKLGIAGMKLATNQAIALLKKMRSKQNIYLIFRYARLERLVWERRDTTEYKSNSYWLFPFPLAPVNEQKRIVAKIEQLFSELDNGIIMLKLPVNSLKSTVKPFSNMPLKASSLQSGVRKMPIN
jgi:type I restriction enzyme S subunit